MKLRRSDKIAVRIYVLSPKIQYPFDGCCILVFVLLGKCWFSDLISYERLYGPCMLFLIVSNNADFRTWLLTRVDKIENWPFKRCPVYLCFKMKFILGCHIFCDKITYYSDETLTCHSSSHTCMYVWYHHTYVHGMIRNPIKMYPFKTHFA